MLQLLAPPALYLSSEPHGVCTLLPSHLWPLGHAEHAVWPVRSWNCPGAQVLHFNLPASSWYFPSGHAVQAADSEPDAAPVFRNLPSVHLVHSVCPVRAWNCPDAQALQVVCPVADWRLPAGHLRHESVHGISPVGLIA